MLTKKRVKVKITYGDSNTWYNKGEVHEVGAYLTYGYMGEKPHYEIKKGFYGISIYHCKPIKTKEKPSSPGRHE